MYSNKISYSLGTLSVMSTLVLHEVVDNSEEYTQETIPLANRILSTRLIAQK